MSEPTDLEALQTLQHSAGWRLFLKHVQGEWGLAGSRYAMAVRTCATNTDDTLALRHLQQVVAIQAEIEKLITWPQERLREIQVGQESRQGDGTSRRGVL